MMFSRVGRLLPWRRDGGATRPAAAASAGSPVAAPGSSTARARRFALRERPVLALLADYAGEVGLLLLVGAAFGWMGPFGSYGLPAADRFGFWVLSMPLVGVPATLAIRACLTVPALTPWPWPWRMLAASGVAEVPGALIVRALSGLFGVAMPTTLTGIVVGYGSVVLIVFAVGTLVMAVTRIDLLRPAAPVTPVAPEPPVRREASPFLRRIPPPLGTTLLRIETEDHYLRVYTDRGSDLVLFRLADALAEIDPALGLQVHRSHWVARRAVAAVEREAHRTMLLLSDGARVPVSRTFLPALRKAGWL